MNQNNALLDPEKKFKAKNNKKYKIKSIIDSTIYNKKVKNQLPSFYYLVL